MSYLLNIKGSETIKFEKEIIYYVHAEVNTPSNSRAKSSEATATMWISGKLFAKKGLPGSSDTVKLFDWSLIPATSADAYRDVTVQVKYEGQLFRTINFPNAFVVDYSEKYNSTSGVGDFSLILRQRMDKMTDVKAE
ncbi:membrane-associated protease 1 [Anaerosinus massiliensis]|uniref:membrane-associated protease 1 n=1 Tax=Massilibacillus massiliensis TaxID=1806837 RepID=UPI000DA61880|nr:membrane-associated protease 1 [Massilibacillus massiliensis]